MKKITPRRLLPLTQILLFVFISMLKFSELHAQIQNNDIIFVNDASFIYISNTAGDYTFGNTISTSTTRTALIYGKIIFANGVNTNGASNDHYLDGYGSTESNSAFIMPVGQSGIYAPVKLTPTTNDGVDAAYYRSNPSAIGTTLNASLSSISSLEYWNVIGPIADAKIALSWRNSSDITSLTNTTLSSLTIAGWNGTEWTEIPSTIDINSFTGGTSSLTSGSISSDSNVDLNTYTYFTLAYKGTACAPLITSSGITKTWDGSAWTPSSPDVSDPVIINAPYSGNLVCNSLQLNADITIQDGQYVEIVYGVTGTGKIIMSSESSVVQRDNTASAPSIKLTKRTRPLRRNDYTYFGTPISGNFFSQLANAKASTGTLAGALDGKYSYVSGPASGSSPNSFWVPLTSITTGKGFIAKIKNQAPFLNNYTTVDYINVPLTGTANNGDVTSTIIIDPANPDGEGSHNLLANPYPCAIDGDKFLTDNINIDGVLYIWQAKTLPVGTSGSYTQSDYIAYTKAGVVYPIPGSIPDTFNGKIASGQGFMTLGLVNNSTVTFTNCMRLTGNNNQFNKTSNATSSVEKDRFKLNLSDGNGLFSQILIGYYPEATIGYDRMYDAGRNSVSSLQLFSILDNSNRQLAINARPIFSDNDTVRLGVSKDNTNPESFSIDIQDREGIFNQGTVTIYLHDKLLNNYHNFNTGSYTFTTSTLSDLDRFEVVYHDNTLGNPNYALYNIIAYINHSTLTINTSSEMDTVDIFDMTGRKIETFSADYKKELSKPFFHAEGVYITKIKFTDGTVGTQKLINKL